MLYIVEIACVIAEIWMIDLFLGGFFERREQSWWLRLAVYVLFGAILTVLSLEENLAYARMISATTGIWLMSMVLFLAKPVHGLIAGVAFMAIFAVTDTLGALFFQLCGVGIDALMTTDARCIYLIVSHIIVLALVLMIQLINRKSHGNISVKILLPVVPCWVISLLLCILLTWQYFEMGYQLHPLFLIVLLGMLYTSIIVIYYTRKINEQAQEREAWEVAEHHYAMQQEYYDQLRVQQEETRAIWHDISKYIRATQVASPDSALDQVQEMLDSIACVVDVNNRIVSVILNEYYQIAKNSDIALHLDVQVPPELFVTAADLYVLIGNTMDNAIEACMDLPSGQRTISLKLKTHNNILFYEIANPYTEKGRGQIKSKYHGYGLKNVSKCVERYAGKVEIQKDNGEFRLTAHLNSR